MSDLDAIWQSLPPLVDRPTLAKQIGLKRHDIDRIFGACVVHRINGSSKPYVLRDDARECIDEPDERLMELRRAAYTVPAARGIGVGGTATTEVVDG